MLTSMCGTCIQRWLLKCVAVLMQCTYVLLRLESHDASRRGRCSGVNISALRVLCELLHAAKKQCFFLDEWQDGCVCHVAVGLRVAYALAAAVDNRCLAHMHSSYKRVQGRNHKVDQVMKSNNSMSCPYAYFSLPAHAAFASFITQSGDP